MRIHALALSTLLTLIACGPDPLDARDAVAALDTTAVVATVRARAEGFGAAVVSGNIDSVLSYLSSDIVLLEPGIDIKGHDAFRALLADLWKVYKVTSFTMNPEAHTEIGRASS